MQEITVGKNESGQRLDKLLSKYLDTAPKSFIYKMLRTGWPDLSLLFPLCLDSGVP